MKALSRIFFYVFLALVLLFWTAFTVGNSEQITLNFLIWQSMGLPIAFWLLFAFIIGGFFGILLCANGFLKGKATQRQLQLELERREQEDASEQAAPPSQNTQVRPMSRPAQNTNSSQIEVSQSS